MRSVALVDDLEAALRAVARPERAEHDRAYLKSDLIFLGGTVPAIRKAATALHREYPGDHDSLVAVVTEAWGRGVHELRMAAVELLDLGVAELAVADLTLLERLVREARTWALVDGLAANVVGALREEFPHEVEPWLSRWAVDTDLWIRRASLLAFLRALRAGGGDFAAFAEKADALLDEREFFIRKAIGWVLRDTGRRRPELVVAWLTPRVVRASGVTVREAVKHLPVADRERLLAARTR